ncbi:putative tetrahydroberberine oxidase [Helianthus debilis subsp. tardiflorus]
MKFNISSCELVSFFLTLVVCFFISTSSNEFLDCLSQTISSDDIVFTPNDTSYSPLLQSRIQNLRFNTTTTPKPLAIITPLSYSHVQSTVICGHDYEGLSYTSFDQDPFIVLDLNQLRSVSVDSQANTAWVESGATLGELSYYVSQKSNLLGFPTGECTSVGVGGQLTGGGYGTMARK